MSYENILITVGTTEFDSLINKIIYGKEALGILKNLNCKNLLCQLGTGNPLVNIDIPGINIISFSLKAEGLQNDIQWADLIISHAG